MGTHQVHPRIHAVKRNASVEVWVDDDDCHSLFTPDCFAYTYWLLVAQEQEAAHAKRQHQAGPLHVGGRS
jgi:hypothetical protein